MAIRKRRANMPRSAAAFVARLDPGNEVRQGLRSFGLQGWPKSSDE
jgi:hypothetical protein